MNHILTLFYSLGELTSKPRPPRPGSYERTANIYKQLMEQHKKKQAKKKYRLLKDLPDHPAGTVFVFEDTGDGYYISTVPGSDGICGRWPPHYVESNPTWFEEVKEPEKISVIVGRTWSTSNGFPVLTIQRTDNMIVPLQQMLRIKEAVENVLNNDSQLETAYQESLKCIGQMFTDKQVEERERLAFDAARKYHRIGSGYEFVNYEQYKNQKLKR